MNERQTPEAARDGEQAAQEETHAPAVRSEDLLRGTRGLRIIHGKRNAVRIQRTQPTLFRPFCQPARRFALQSPRLSVIKRTMLVRVGRIDRRSQARARRHVEPAQKMYVFPIPACGSDRFRKSPERQPAAVAAGVRDLSGMGSIAADLQAALAEAVWRSDPNAARRVNDRPLLLAVLASPISVSRPSPVPASTRARPGRTAC